MQRRRTLGTSDGETGADHWALHAQHLKLY
jgi:hypothetical protein